MLSFFLRLQVIFWGELKELAAFVSLESSLVFGHLLHRPRHLIAGEVIGEADLSFLEQLLSWMCKYFWHTIKIIVLACHQAAFSRFEQLDEGEELLYLLAVALGDKVLASSFASTLSVL